MKKLFVFVYILLIFSCKEKDKVIYDNEIIKQGNLTKFRNAELESMEGIPVLTLSGNYYEMGLGYGVLMKKEISQILTEFHNYKKTIKKGLPWYFKPFFEIILNAKLNKMKRRIPQKYLDEINGFCDGSKMPYNDVLFCATAESVLGGGLCTTFIKRLDDRIVQGRNFDFAPSFFGKYPIIIEYHPKSKISYTVFNVIGYLGCFDGINEKGISISENGGGGAFNKNSKGLFNGYKKREILESSSSLSEVESLIHKIKTSEPGVIFTVTSAYENSGAIFDIFDDTITKQELSDSSCIYTFNKIFPQERCNNDEYRRNYLDFFNGEGQYNNAREYSFNNYLKNKINTIDDVLTILRSTDFYQYNEYIGSDVSTIANEKTLFTLIYDLQKRNVYFSFYPGYSSLNKILKYDLEKKEINLYKEIDVKYSNRQIDNFQKWYNDYQILSLEHNYKEIIKMTDFSKDLNQVQLNCIYNIWSKNKKLIDQKILLASTDKLIKKYDDVSFFYLVKGKIFYKINEFEKAIECFEKALNSKIIFNYDKIKIYSFLVDSYEKIGNKNMSLIYAKECITLIDNLKLKYKITTYIKNIYTKMKKIELRNSSIGETSMSRTAVFNNVALQTT